MTYTTFLGKTYEDEHDEELTRKFGDTYNYFKKEYPGLHKLPTEEVEGIYSEFKKSPYGDTFEKSVDRTKQYIRKRMPQWQKQYINSKPKQEQSLRGLQTQKQQSGEQTQQSDPWLEQRRRQAENNLLMNGMDTLYGMNRAVNGMTFGGLDWLGNKIGFDSQMKEYLNLKDPENRNLAQTAGNIAQLGGAMLTGKALNTSVQNAYNQFTRWNGRRNLINQLHQGDNFKDIRYQNISDEHLNALNNIRSSINQPMMQNNKMTIPANVIRKWYNKRIVNEGMTPQELANSIDNSIYNSNSVVFRTKYDQNQALVNPTGNKLDVGFVSVNPSNPKQNVIKSDYQIKIDDLSRVLFGNQ